MLIFCELLPVDKLSKYLHNLRTILTLFAYTRLRGIVTNLVISDALNISFGQKDPRVIDRKRFSQLTSSRSTITSNGADLLRFFSKFLYF
jgi:hypothetical protein